MTKRKSFSIGKGEYEELKRVPASSKSAKIFSMITKEGIVDIWVANPDKTERRESTLVIECLPLQSKPGRYEVIIYPQKIDELPEDLRLSVRALLSRIGIRE